MITLRTYWKLISFVLELYSCGEKVDIEGDGQADFLSNICFGILISYKSDNFLSVLLILA